MCTVDDPIATYGELRRRGASRHRIRADVDLGALRPLRRGVYARAGACAAVETAALHGGALACVSAARHLGLWVLDEEPRVHVSLGRHGHTRTHDLCACVEHWDDAGSPGTFGTPSVPRVLRQILGCRGIEHFFVALESALRQSRLSPADLDWLRAHTNAVAREAMEFARCDADSGLESLLRWRLRPLGLEVRSQVRIVSVGLVDFLIGDALIVEVDGRENHESAAMRHKDLTRDAHAAAWGYVTLRFDYALIVHDWPTVELAILSHLDRGLHLRSR